MPFKLDIIDKIQGGNRIASFGIVKEPIVTLDRNYYPRSIGTIELELHGTHRFNVDKTWLKGDTKIYKYYQSLRIDIISAHFGNLYIIGVLIDEPPKDVRLYIGENDKQPKDLTLPFIPKTNEDYVSYLENVYQTEKVVYKKDEVCLFVAEQPYATEGEFEREFFRQN